MTHEASIQKFCTDDVLIAPSILSANFAQLQSEIESIKTADMVHVDVMDGHFVPNLTIGPAHVSTLKKITALPLDVHLMIDNPLTQLPWYLDAGADSITVHFESFDKHELQEQLEQAANFIHNNGVKAALALNPETPVSEIENTDLALWDMFLIMSVHPGFSGQSFIENTPEKIKQLCAMLEQENLSIPIQVDGGINVKTALLVLEAGANILVAGNAVFKEDDRAAAIENLRKCSSSSDKCSSFSSECSSSSSKCSAS